MSRSFYSVSIVNGFSKGAHQKKKEKKEEKKHKKNLHSKMGDLDPSYLLAKQ